MGGVSSASVVTECIPNVNHYGSQLDALARMSPRLSSECHSSQYSTVNKKKRNVNNKKPPNVLVYSESNDIRTNIIATLKNILHPDRYTIYELKAEQLKTSIWIDNTTLLIVCGPISPERSKILMEYFLSGGKMLCLCSDVLNMVMPIYRTAEVKEEELVQFSYGRWQNIELMHHIFSSEKEDGQQQNPLVFCGLY